MSNSKQATEALYSAKPKLQFAEGSKSAQAWKIFDFREIAWIASGLADGWDLNFRAWRVFSDLSRLADSDDCHLYFDFSSTATLLGWSREAEKNSDFNPHENSIVVFDNIPNPLAEKIRREWEGDIKPQISGGKLARIVCGDGVPIDLPLLRAQLLSHENRVLQESIRGTYETFSEAPLKMDAPLLWGNGMYHSQKLISKPVDFIRACLGLADLCYKCIEKLKSDEKRPEIRLLVSSPRGAAFAGPVSLICGVRLDVTTMMRSPNRRDAGISYIFIADFLAGGTEFKVAKSIAWQNHSTVTHCVSLGTFVDPDFYSSHGEVEVTTIVSPLEPDMGFKLSDRRLK